MSVCLSSLRQHHNVPYFCKVWCVRMITDHYFTSSPIFVLFPLPCARSFDSALRFVLSTSHYCVHSKKKRGYENSLNYGKRYISLPNWAGCSSVVTAPCGYIYFFVVVFLQEFNKTDEIQIRDLHRFGPVNQTTLAFFSSVINTWPTSNFLKLNKSFCWL